MPARIAPLSRVSSVATSKWRSEGLRVMRKVMLENGTGPLHCRDCPPCPRAAPAMPRTLDRRPTLLVVGCGDVGLRVLRLLAGRWRLLALTSSPARCAELRAAGAVPLVGNLDQSASLRRLAGLADAVLHLAPPPLRGDTDPRTRALAQALRRPGGQ